MTDVVDIYQRVQEEIDVDEQSWENINDEFFDNRDKISEWDEFVWRDGKKTNKIRHRTRQVKYSQGREKLAKKMSEIYNTIESFEKINNAEKFIEKQKEVQSLLSKWNATNKNREIAQAKLSEYKVALQDSYSNIIRNTNKKGEYEESLSSLRKINPQKYGGYRRGIQQRAEKEFRRLFGG